MKRFLLLFTVLISCLSCKPSYVPRNIDQITIQEFKRNKTSIRALIAVSNDTLLYAGSNGDVGATYNGGKDWSSQTLSYQDSIIPAFRSMAKTSKGIFVLSIANPALLYKITKGKSELVYTEKNPSVFYDALHFIDDQHGIAVGDPTESCASIISTQDGGNTWQKMDCSNLPELAQGEAFFAASNTNIASVNNTIWIGTGGTKARILKSSDAGKTWTIFNTPFVQGDGPQGIYSIAFYDEQNGIAIGGDYSKPTANKGNKAITRDGGKTWTLVADNQNPAYKSCVQYVPGTQGKEVFAVGVTGISFSNDGGTTWKEVSKEPYYTIQFVDKNTAWLSGSQKIGKLKLQ